MNYIPDKVGGHKNYRRRGTADKTRSEYDMFRRKSQCTTSYPIVAHAGSRKGRLKAQRQGVAAVELAVMSPIIILLIVASIDACSMIYLKQSLTIAAYEGGRTAVLPGMNAADIEVDCTAVLTDRDIADADIDISPSNLNSADAGDPIVVTVTAPCDANAILPGLFFGGRTVEGRAEVMKEYD